MKEELTMSVRELDRLGVVRRVIEKRLTWKEAGEHLSLSERQVGYLSKRVREEGPRGVIHRLRGQPSNHRLDPELMEIVIGIVRERYGDFGPTLAQEKLEEIEGIKVSVSALRKGMIRAGQWQVKRGRKKHRSWRQRRSCVGALVQLDGSVHDWFEGRGPSCVLIAYIDDATSRVMYLKFVHSEDTLTLLMTTKSYINCYGRPVAFYVDKDSIYQVNRQATIEEELRDVQALTQFTRAMTELEIEVLPANSPQAKGRVERLFKTLQDRLVKELRLRGISDIDTANRFLRDYYLDIHNARFAVEPANPTDAHRPLRKGQRLDEILCIRTERTLMNDFTLRYQNEFYQIWPTRSVRVCPRAKIQVETHLDGSIHLRYRGHYLHFNVLPSRPVPGHSMARPSPRTGLQSVRPAQNHPWRKPLFRRQRTTTRSPSQPQTNP